MTTVQLSLTDILDRAPEPPPVLVQSAPRVVRDVRDNQRAADPERLTDGQWRALSAHWLHGEGLTDFELAEAMGPGFVQTGAGKRRVELERAGLIEFTGQRRATGNGGLAGVYRITPDGCDAALVLSRRAA